MGLRLLHECFYHDQCGQFPADKEKFADDPTGKVMFKSLSSALHYTFNSKSFIVEMF